MPSITVYLTLVVAGTALGAVLTPLVGSGATTLGLVDAPGGRKVHSSSVPRLGGLAIATAATLALMLVLFVLGPTPSNLSTVAPIAAGALLVLAIGLLDDVRPLPPWPKLGVQVLAAVLVMASDLRIERITVAGQTWHLGVWSWAATLIWLVGVTNAFNMIDGLDGLAAGVSVIAGTTCTAILVARGHAAEAMLLAALVGAALGFLVYNFSPATIFLGDGGSLLFGFVLATTAITGWQKGATALAAGVPLLIFALPLADLATTIVRRALGRGERRGTSVRLALARVFEPDRQHIHHRLLGLGLSTRGAVALLYGVTLVLSIVALATAQLD